MMRMHKVQNVFYHQGNEQVQTRVKYSHQRTYNHLTQERQQCPHKESNFPECFCLRFLFVFIFLRCEPDFLEQLKSRIGKLCLLVKEIFTGFFGGENFVYMGKAVEMEPAKQDILIEGSGLFLPLAHSLLLSN